MATTIRKVSAIQLASDPSTITLRRASATAFVSDAGVTLRNIQGYAFASIPPGVTLRNVQGFAFAKVQAALPLSKAGNLALYDLINNNRKVSLIFSSSNTALGVPAVLSQIDANGHNTSVTLTALNSSGYSGSITFNYARRPITDAISASISLGTIASDTTVSAMLPTINSKYGLNLTAQDIIDGPVKAGAVAVTLTIASTSYVFIPGSVAYAGVSVALNSAISTVGLSGFLNAAGTL